jgi:hypothetical protein
MSPATDEVNLLCDQTTRVLKHFLESHFGLEHGFVQPERPFPIVGKCFNWGISYDGLDTRPARFYLVFDPHGNRWGWSKLPNFITVPLQYDEAVQSFIDCVKGIPEIRLVNVRKSRSILLREEQSRFTPKEWALLHPNTDR